MGWSSIRNKFNYVIKYGWKPQGRRLPSDRDASIRLPFVARLPVSSPQRLGVVCHVYHADMAAMMSGYVGHLAGAVRIFVSTDSAAKKRQVEDEWRLAPGHVLEVRVVENRGRDLPSKLVHFNDVIDSFDIVLFLHSKKHREDDDYGRRWRDRLFGSLAGSDAVAADIVSLFAANPQLGIVFPQHLPAVRKGVKWLGHFGEAKALLARADITLGRRDFIDFPAGSMFWCRPQVLAPLRKLGLGLSDFPAEGGQFEGTLAHVLERTLLYSCEKAGFFWLKVIGEDDDERPVATIEGASDLESFVQANRAGLLRSSPA